MAKSSGLPRPADQRGFLVAYLRGFVQDRGKGPIARLPHQ
jgi:hypothetical protein